MTKASSEKKKMFFLFYLTSFPRPIPSTAQHSSSLPKFTHTGFDTVVRLPMTAKKLASGSEVIVHGHQVLLGCNFFNFCHRYRQTGIDINHWSSPHTHPVLSYFSFLSANYPHWAYQKEQIVSGYCMILNLSVKLHSGAKRKIEGRKLQFQ